MLSLFLVLLLFSHDSIFLWNASYCSFPVKGPQIGLEKIKILNHTKTRETREFMEDGTAYKILQ